MNKTKKVRKGGAGFIETLFQKKSPFTSGPTITPGEAALEKEMKKLNKNDEKRNNLRLKLANMRGKTLVLNIKENPMLKKGGKQKTLRRQKRSRTRRHH